MNSRKADRELAAYIGGLAAQKQGDLAEAERLLRIASLSADTHIANDAAISLGLAFSEMGKHGDAAFVLQRTADRLTGEDRAKAYFYAGIAQQKVGRWGQARTSLVLARAASQGPKLWQAVNEQLQVTGYTLQLGAYRNPTYARSAVQNHAARLTALGIGPAQLVRGRDSQGREVTFVQAGRFHLFQQAARAKASLGTVDSIIVPLKKR